MIDADIRDLLGEISKTTQAIGKRIGSTKNDLDDLACLAETLKLLGEAIVTTSNIVKLRVAL